MAIESSRRERLIRLAARGTVVAASAYALWLARVELVGAPGISLRTDLGSHVVAIRHLVEESLPAGRLLDWSHQWFAGYPSFYFYFPLPALVIAALALAFPLNIAAKTVAVTAPALLPPAVYVAVRAAGFGRPHAAGAAAASTALLSLTAYYGYGGNVLASVIGEYSYALALALALLYLAAVQQSMRGARRLPHMALLLAATALAHVIPTIFAVAGSCAALRSRARRDVVAGWVLGFLLCAFWALPFLVRSPYMGRIGWPFALDARELVPAAVLVVLPWAAAGGVVLWRTGVRPGVLALLGSAAALSAFVPHTLFAPQRGLPIAHLALYMLAGLGVIAGFVRARASGRRAVAAWWLAGAAVLVGVCVLQAREVRVRSGMLLASAAPDSAAYDELARTLAGLPGGRVLAENWTEGGGALGDRLSPGRLPLYDRRIRAAIGLLRESAYTSPAYYSLLKGMSWDTAVSYLRQYPAPADTSSAGRIAALRRLGIDYYVTFSSPARAWAASQADELRAVATHADWTLWSVRGSALVEPVPRVRAGGDGAAAGWLAGVTDTTAWWTPDAGALGVSAIYSRRGALLPARAIELEPRLVRFQAQAIGIPHVVRVGFFPNWRAYGAYGPYPVEPGFMLVVPWRDVVTLRFERTWVEWAGLALTAVGLLLLAAAVGAHKLRRRQAAAG